MNKVIKPIKIKRYIRGKPRKKVIGYRYYNVILPSNWEKKLKIVYDVGEYVATVNNKFVDSWSAVNIVELVSNRVGYNWSDYDADYYYIYVYGPGHNAIDEIDVEEFIKNEIRKKAEPIYSYRRK
ncbi:MAG: hypothetical protein ACTSYD_02395 [Candidatus Heimdallarchaeaceae archaeon]